MSIGTSEEGLKGPIHAQTSAGEERDARAPSRSSRPDRPLAFVALTKEASGSYFPGVRSVGLKTLKNKLSEYVRLAASGETIVISDRERVVAELVPPRETRERSLPDVMLADAVRSGILTPAVLPPGPPPEPPSVGTLAEILTDLEADRADP